MPKATPFHFFQRIEQLIHSARKIGKRLVGWEEYWTRRISIARPWGSIVNGWCIIRFDPDGKEMMRVKLPVQRPTACTFGGVDRTTLYITTASVGLSEAEIEDSFYSGDLFGLPTHRVGLPTYCLRQ
ncbi:SMP-30/gluconolactonase/LRE family protein [Leptolyngbya sp. DQ-M1]|uniref:SMP-30/gluconolactonase/LRE family protein n=1 Tax=Leptolyngbya sp. DQ-M1 TaxID=2933920 RepID=UPI00329945BB